MHLSVVIPVYGSPTTLEDLVSRITAALPTAMEFEIILVNDACPQGSWQVVQELVGANTHVVGVNLSRNFGQHYAITAGLETSRGDWVVVMDCDLQDVPEEIPNLLAKADEGYDIVFASREDRQDSAFKRLGSRGFYAVLSYATGTYQTERIGNFGIYSRKVVDALLRFREQLRFLPVNARWLGFKTFELPVQHAARVEGSSSYTLGKLFRLAFGVMFGFSNKPMGLLIRLGLFIAAMSVGVAMIYIARYLANDITVQGWTSIMVSLWFMFGCLLAALGVIGIYVAKAFDEAKQRPIYIIDDVIGRDPAKSPTGGA